MQAKGFFSIENPVIVFFFIWTFSILLGVLLFDAFSLESAVLIVVYGVCYLAGVVFGFFVHCNPKPVLHVKVSYLFLLLYLLMLIDFIYLYQMCELIFFKFDSLAEAMFQIRQASINGEPIIHNLNLFIGANQMLFGISIYSLIVYLKGDASSSVQQGTRLENKVKFLILTTVFSMLLSILDGSRSFFIFTFIVLLNVLTILKVISYSRLFLYGSSCLIIFALTFPIFRPDITTIEGGFFYTGIYISGGVTALSSVLSGDVTVYWGDLERLLNKLYFFGEYDLQSMDMVDLDEDHQTNVFTMLGVYYQYFGFALPLVALVNGIVGGFLLKAWERTSLLTLAYVFYMTSTVLSIFSEYYLSSLYLTFKIVCLLFSLSILSHIFKIFLSTVRNKSNR